MQSLTTLFVIAVAVALAVALVGLYSSLLLDTPPGVSNAERVVSVGRTDGERFEPLNGRLQSHLRESSIGLTGVAGVSYLRQEARLREEQRHLDIGLVSEGFFQVVGVRLVEGRILDASDHGESARVVVISYRLRDQVFGDLDSPLGESITIQGERFRVVGVTAAGFRGVHRDAPTDIWVPHQTWQNVVAAVPAPLIERLPLILFGRIAKGTSLGALRENLSSLQERLPAAAKEDLGGMRLAVSSTLSRDPAHQQMAERQLELFALSAVLLAVIAAANLSLFFLARAPKRQREMAIRMALGATHCRLLGQMFVEASLLVVAGGLLGLLLSLWLVTGLKTIPTIDVDHWDGALIDTRTLLFAMGLIALLAAVVALAPVMDLRRRTILERSRPCVTRIRVGQRLLAVVQVGVAGLVIAVAAFLAMALAQLLVQGPGYKPEGVQVFVLQPDVDGPFRPDFREAPNLHRQIRERLLALEGVDAVGFQNAVPTRAHPEQQPFRPENGQKETVQAAALVGRADWLRVLDVRVLRGSLPESDDELAVVVNRQFALQAWGDIDVVGKWLQPPRHLRGGDPSRVAAVIDDLSFGHPAEPERAVVMLNTLGVMDFAADVLVRGELSQDSLAEAIGTVLADFTPPLHVTERYALQGEYDALLAPDRARVVVSTAAASVVGAIALLGFFGILRYMVENGRFEFALRAALGAGPRQLRRQVMWRGLVLGFPGLVFAFLLAAIGLSLVGGRLDIAGLSQWPAILVAITGLALALWLASRGPARQASHTEPGKYLRDE
ncbi:ABC transporter permease [Natronospira sp.]|uniref:ABC transporter permease n=1 Tax=Natronospira sp. TaxID=2024970 RepID=UPI003873B191